jgi:hypothetical protein
MLKSNLLALQKQAVKLDVKRSHLKPLPWRTLNTVGYPNCPAFACGSEKLMVIFFLIKRTVRDRYLQVAYNNINVAQVHTVHQSLCMAQRINKPA